MDKKLNDLLFTTRWAISNDKKEYAYEKITEALQRVGALKTEIIEPDEEPKRPNDIKPVKFTVPEFIEVKGVRFKEQGNYRTPSGMFEGLVVHHTVSGRTAKNAISVLKYLAREGLGCMVMDEDGKIYVAEGFDPLRDVAWHAGKSKWEGKTGLSKTMAGMEICCWGRDSKVGPFRESGAKDNIVPGKYQAYTDAQESSLTNFILWALDVNEEFKVSKLVGHDEIRAEYGLPGDKSDPGASLSKTMPEYREYIQTII